MAQLEQDEWPKDGEPTTSEEEDGAFKREGPNPPDRPTGQSKDPVSRVPDESGVRNVDRDRAAD